MSLAKYSLQRLETALLNESYTTVASTEVCIVTYSVDDGLLETNEKDEIGDKNDVVLIYSRCHSILSTH